MYSLLLRFLLRMRTNKEELTVARQTVARQILSLIKAVTAPFICSIVLAPIRYLYQFGILFVLCSCIKSTFCIFVDTCSYVLTNILASSISHSTNTNHVCFTDCSSVFYQRWWWYFYVVSRIGSLLGCWWCS